MSYSWIRSFTILLISSLLFRLSVSIISAGMFAKSFLKNTLLFAPSKKVFLIPVGHWYIFLVRSWRYFTRNPFSSSFSFPSAMPSFPQWKQLSSNSVFLKNSVLQVLSMKYFSKMFLKLSFGRRHSSGLSQSRVYFAANWFILNISVDLGSSSLKSWLIADYS